MAEIFAYTIPIVYYVNSMCSSYFGELTEQNIGTKADVSYFLQSSWAVAYYKEGQSISSGGHLSYEYFFLIHTYARVSPIMDIGRSVGQTVAGTFFL